MRFFTILTLLLSAVCLDASGEKTFNSQAGQDEFVHTLLYDLLEKQDAGYYLEIGAGKPIQMNNTYVFEKENNWKGISIDILEDLRLPWSQERSNSLLLKDATQIDYTSLLKDFPHVMDYLSLDVDGLYDTVLKLVMNSNHVFKIITIEHDVYRFGETYRNNEREILTALGYILLCSDVTNCGFAFEDWWIHPDFFPAALVQQLKSLMLDNKDGKEIVQNIKTLNPRGVDFSKYRQICRQAAQDDALFAKFKREPHYSQILEHLTYGDGLRYKAIIEERYPEILALVDQFRINDQLGSPLVYSYGECGLLSPTTLRYIKVAGDIRQEFAGLRDMHIIEIGGGYGGQCKILSDLTGFASYTIVDLPECIALAKKYLDKLNVKNVHFINALDLKNLKEKYDLVISNYAFSEVKKEGQLLYIEKIMKSSSRGYVTTNFLSSQENNASVTLDEMLSILLQQNKKGWIKGEVPITGPTNHLLLWRPIDEYRPTQIVGAKTHQSYPSAISYRLSGGRIGDSLIAYFHAKWAAMTLGLPFIYQPFPGVEALSLQGKESSAGTFSNTVHISKLSQIQQKLSSVLFLVPYFPEYRFESVALAQSETTPAFLKSLPYFEVDWEDPEFHKEVVACLTPKIAVNTLSPPQEKISVAVHVRRAGNAEEYAAMPLKFPPDAFYISEIKRIQSLFKDQMLYVYVFTDDPHPEEIVRKFSESIKSPMITWDYRKSTPSLWEDFYSIGKFDCLIRPTSNFSIMASQLGNYKLVITPTRYSTENNQVVINEVETLFKS